MHILLISLSMGGGDLAASYRPIKLAKYLCKNGHRVTIVTSTDIAEELKFLYDEKIQAFNISNPLNKYTKSIFHKTIIHLSAWPDPGILWVKKVLNILPQKTPMNLFDLVLISTPPHSIQMAGAEINRKYSIPYIADLRDDWLTNWRHKWHTPFHKYSAKKCEERMVKSAKAVVVNTPIVAGRFKKRYKNYAQKIHPITNGYDENDFDIANGLKFIESDGRQILLYAGGNYGEYVPLIMKKICCGLKENGLLKDWRIITAGPNIDVPLEYSNTWQHAGMLSQKDVLAAMIQANLLLLLMPPGEKSPSGTVPLKAYQYLRSKTAIAYLGEKGSSSDLINEFDGTFHLQRDSIGDLINIMKKSKLLSVKYKRQGIEKYNFSSISKKFLELIS